MQCSDHGLVFGWPALQRRDDNVENWISKAISRFLSGPIHQVMPNLHRDSLLWQKRKIPLLDQKEIGLKGRKVLLAFFLFPLFDWFCPIGVFGLLSVS